MLGKAQLGMGMNVAADAHELAHARGQRITEVGRSHH
jgi:hypothetical protein